MVATIIFLMNPSLGLTIPQIISRLNGTNMSILVSFAKLLSTTIITPPPLLCFLLCESVDNPLISNIFLTLFWCFLLQSLPHVSDTIAIPILLSLKSSMKLLTLGPNDLTLQHKNGKSPFDIFTLGSLLILVRFSIDYIINYMKL